MEQVKTGLIRGTGAAVSIPLGWVPDMILIFNATDGDHIWSGMPGYSIIPFTSGGTTTITGGNPVTVGSLIKGATGGATARVQDVILDSGSWVGGDAAGWLVVDKATMNGVFGTEAYYMVGGGTVDDLTAVLDVTFSQDTALAVAGATGNNAVAPFAGTVATTSAGFTIGLTISEDAKLLGFCAFRSGEGGQGYRCQNSL